MTKEKSFFYGSLFSLASNVFLSIGFLIGKLTTEELPFFFLVFFRYFLGFIILSCFLALRGQLKSCLKTKKILVHFLRGLVVTTSQSLLFIYLTYGNLLNATLFMNLAPLYIPLIERFVNKRRIGVSTSVSIFISMIGVLFILKPSSDLFQPISIIGLLSGVFWASSQVIYGHNVHHEKKEVNIFYLFLTCTLLSAPLLLLSPEVLVIEIYKDPLLPLLLLGLAIVTLLTQYFRGIAYSFYSPSALSPFLYTGIVLSGLFDWLVFQNFPSASTLLGAGLIILGGLSKVVVRSYMQKINRTHSL